MDIGFNIFDQGSSYLNSQSPLLDQYLFPLPEQLGRLPSSLLGVENLDIPVFTPTTLSSTFTVNSPFSGLHPLIDTLVGASPVVSAEAVNISLLQVGKSFSDFLQQPNYLDSLQLAFGSGWQAETATAIITDLAQGHNLPAIEVVTGAELQAQGAFSQQTNTIYLAQEFVAQNSTNAIAKVLTEEIGHYIDTQLNPIDTPGDEGELFAALVDGIELTPAQLQAIKAEDDHKIVTINGQTLLVEQSVNEIVGTGGRDVLTGTAQSDRIIAGAGADLITGGLGADTFVYQNIRDAGDIIKDFELRQDVIDVSQVLSGFGYQGFKPIADGYIQFGTYTGGTVILLDSDGKGSLAARPYIYVEKVTPTDLSSYLNHFIPNPGEPPQIQASLVNDTGVSKSDRLTFDPTIKGKVTRTSSLVSLKAGLNNQPVTANIFDTLQSDGSFSLTSARLRQINGGSLNDGAYTLKLQATDNKGNISSVYSFNFVLDTKAPVLNLQLDPNFDSAPVGDLQTTFEKVNLLGTTEANLAVSLQQTGVSSTSNNLGQFTFANISLIPGSNLYTVLTTDLAGNQGAFSQTFQRLIQPVNAAPKNLNLNPASSAENVLVNSLIGKFTTIDPDVGDTHIYSLVTGAGDTDNAAFAIIGNELRIKQSPDFETKSTYSVRVRTQDAGGLFFDKIFSISITNVNETPTALNISNSAISENIPVNSIIGTFSSTDPDIGDTHSYSLISGDGDTDNAAFAIVGNELRIKQSPNFEVKSDYSIRVRTQDAGGLFFDKIFSIDIINVNEAPAIALPPSQSVVENTNLIINGINISDVDAGSGKLQVTVAANQGVLTLGQTTGLTFTIGDGNTDGSVTFTGTLTAINQALTGLIYRGNPGFSGNDTITVTVNDLGNSGSGGALTVTNSLMVTVNSTGIVLREDNFFLRNYEQSITIPATTSVLSFTYSNLNFDTTDPDSIKDAFEVALVDAQGNSLIHTIKANRDAFLNITESQGVALAAGATIEGQTVKVNLAGLAPGTAKVIFRLVNNDDDTNTTVRLNNIQISPTEGIAPVAVTPEGSLAAVNRAINFTLLSDVTSSFIPEYRRTSFNEDTKLLYADIAVRNAGTYLVDTPLVVAIKSLSDPSVQVVGADGLTPEGLPFFNLSNLVADGSLDPNEQTLARTISFFNPQQVQFDYELVFLGQLNIAPEFVSEPDVEALVGKPYVYEAKAQDANNDTLAYSLLVAPQGMVIERATGKISWTPAASAVGNYTVTVQVADGRGGVDTQDFVLGVITPPPNRSPLITSIPIVDANVNREYKYQAIATDPDGDTLTYSLVNSPQGMTIDQKTGLISWTPNVTGEREVWLKVEDGKGGASEQIYKIFAQQEAGNHAPVIISDPVTKVYPVLNTSQPQLFDLSKWSVVQYELNEQPDANWKIQTDKTFVEQTINADASILLSDSNLINKRIEGTWKVNTTSDDDFMGFVFGYQDSQHFYLFDWKQSDQNDPLGFAERGMSIKVVGADSPLTGVDFWPTAGNGQRVRSLFHNTITWKDFTEYKFTLDFTPGKITITVKEGETVLESATIEDNTYNSGKFGFYNYSQSNVIYNGFTQQSLKSWNYSYDVEAIDPDKDNLTYDLIKAPTGAEIDKQTGEIVWDSNFIRTGQFEFTVQVEDDKGGVDTQDFVVEVSNTAVGEIQGTKWEDVNGDGIRNNEPGLAGLTVYLDSNNNGLLDSGEPTQITVFDNPNTPNIDETGQYKFTGLNPGNYIVREVIPRGYQQTFPGVNIPSKSVAVNIPGTSNPWLAGMPNGSTASSNDTAPAQSPIYISDLPLFVGSRLAFDVAGSVNNDPFPSGLTPDGGDFFSHRALAENGIANLIAPINSLVGVFLGSDLPNLTSAPSQLDFSNPNNATGGINYTILTPQLKQVFFIGDGINKQGVRQQVVIPQGANRLFLGTMDGHSWYNNFGLFNVTITSQDLSKPDFYTVNLKAGEIVENINFGNQKTGAITQNKPPVFTSTAPAIASVGELLRYNAKATDPDGDSPSETLRERLTFDLPVKPEGMAIDENTGILVWNPKFDQTGIQDVILRVQDGYGGVTLQAFQIQVNAANTAPVITSTPPIQAIANLPYQYRVRAQDAEGDTLTYNLTNAPTGMTINVTTGVISYTPTIAQLGDRPVAITITDSKGITTTQSYTLKVVASANNNLPTITSTPRDRIRLGSDYYYIAEVTDPDGDPITFSLDNAPTGMTVDEEGIVRWTPTAAKFGANSATLKVSDGRGTPVTQTFSINVTSQNSNQAPSIDSKAPLVATANRQYQYNIVTSDPDGDPVVLNLNQAPQGMSIDPISGKLRWTPRVDQIGNTEVIVEAFDGQGGLTQQKFTVTVRGANLPPTIISTPPTIGVLNKVYTYQVKATDPENDPLTYNLINNPPTGMKIDAKTGLIQWTPSQLGEQKIEILVNDGQGGVNIQTFRLQILDKAPNLLPTITSKPVVGVTPGVEYKYDVDATDPEGTAIAYSLQNKPEGMTIDPQTGLIKWQTTSALQGEFPVIVVATDAAGGRAIQSFKVQVAANNAPVIISTPATNITQGQDYRYDIKATDANGDRLTYTLVNATQGITLDNFGRLTWKPNNLGLYPVAIKVEDGRGGVATQAFDLTVTNDTQAPLINLGNNGTLFKPGDTLQLQVSATDNVGVESLNLTFNGSPLVLNPGQFIAGNIQTTTVTLNQSGVFEILAQAKDAAGNIGTKSLQVRVFAPTDNQAPVVIIDTAKFQATGGLITSLTDLVGTVTDDNLEFYRVEYAPVSLIDLNNLADFDPDYITIAQGNSNKVNTVLGKIDPTVLRNDSYFFRVIARDVNGLINTQGVVLSVFSENKPGRFALTFTDLSIPLTGIPIEIQRRYDSLDAQFSGDFGHGWSLGFQDAQIQEAAPTGVDLSRDNFFGGNSFTVGTRVTLTTPDGRRVGFTFNPVPDLAGLLGVRYKPTFTPDAGVYDRLEVDYTPLSVRSDGSVGLYLFGFTYNPSQYRLITKDGTTYRYDQYQGLLDITDRNGNKLTYTDAGIFSSTGQSVNFNRDAQGRITEIIDPVGKGIIYNYDAQGNLLSVSDRNNSTTQFVYDTQLPSYLTEIIDPLGRKGTRTEYDDQGRLTKIIDAEGNALDLNYTGGASSQTIKDPLGNNLTRVFDVRGNVVQEADALGGITKRTFDNNNNLLSETDPEGNTKSYTYDSRGNILTETDGEGNTKRYTYNGRNDILTETDALGNVTTYTYDANGNLSSRKDTLGNVTTYKYDQNGLLTEVIDANGQTSTFRYDVYGNLTELVDPTGGKTTFTYDNNGRVTSVTDALGAITNYIYDQQGRLIEKADPEGSSCGCARGITKTEYNAAGEKIAEIDALGRRTEYRYNERGLLIETILPDSTPDILTDNPRTKNEYDALDRLTIFTDELGRKTYYVYDALGRQIEVIYPDSTPNNLSDNPRTKKEYDKAGLVIAEIDELGNRTQFEYDNADRLIKVTNALNEVTTYTYDKDGRRVSMTDALGRKTVYVYDGLDRQIEVIYPDNTPNNLQDNLRSQTKYDGLGRVIAETDLVGNTTKYEYDELGRLTAVIDALNQRTEYKYDAVGNLIEQKDANGNITKFEYDSLRRLQATTLPEGQENKTIHNKIGNLIEVTDFNGVVTTYKYNERNWLIEKSFSDGTPTETFTYTATGNLATVTDNRGVTTYSYDERDRLIYRTEPDGRQIQYTYDKAGNILTLNVPSGTTTYTYDALNRIDTVKDADNGVTDYDYDAVGNLIKTVFPNGVIENQQYDFLNRLLYLENRNQTGIISSYTYTLDGMGNRLKLEENDGRIVEYSYDKLYRLTQEKITDSVAGDQTIQYQFDAVGNRLQKINSVDGITTYIYDDNDQLLQEILGGKVTKYQYDNEGNLTAKIENGQTQTVYEWNAKGELTAVEVTENGETGRIVFEYDHNGIRVSINADGEETRFLLDNNQQQYAQIIEEYQVNGNVKTTYTHGWDLISQDNGNNRIYYQVDGLGSSRQLTDINGAVVVEYDYDAYGNLIRKVGDADNNYLFAGEQFDEAVDGYYLRARYYDTVPGRFVSTDPFEGYNNQPITLHDYLYAGVNPVNAIDPSGEVLLDTSAIFRYVSLRVAPTIAFVGRLNFYILQFVKSNINFTTKRLFGDGAEIIEKNIKFGTKIRNVTSYNTKLKAIKGFEEEAATDFFVRLSRQTEKLTVKLKDGRQVSLRTSKTGPTTVEVVNEIEKIVEKIRFIAD